MEEIRIQTIQEIVPDATTNDIQSALSLSNGDVAGAVENLLPDTTSNEDAVEAVEDPLPGRLPRYRKVLRQTLNFSYGKPKKFGHLR